MSEYEDLQMNGDSGAAEAIPKQCSALRKGEHVLLKGQPCKIVEMTSSKTGKHGHAKVHLVGLQLFTDKKYEDICPSTHNMLVPLVKRKEYQVIDVSEEGYLGLMDEGGKVRHDLRLPESLLGKELRARFEKDEPLLASVMLAMNEERVMSFKLDTSIKP